MGERPGGGEANSFCRWHRSTNERGLRCDVRSSRIERATRRRPAAGMSEPRRRDRRWLQPVRPRRQAWHRNVGDRHASRDGHRWRFRDRGRGRRPPLLDDAWRREMLYRREGVRDAKPSEPCRGLRGEGFPDADIVVERSLQDEHSLTVPRQFQSDGRTRGTTTKHGDVVTGLGVGHGCNADAAPRHASHRPRDPLKAWRAETFIPRHCEPWRQGQRRAAFGLASQRPRPCDTEKRALGLTTATLAQNIRAREAGPTAWSRRECPSLLERSDVDVGQSIGRVERLCVRKQPYPSGGRWRRGLSKSITERFPDASLVTNSTSPFGEPHERNVSRRVSHDGPVPRGSMRIHARAKSSMRTRRRTAKT